MSSKFSLNLKKKSEKEVLSETKSEATEHFLETYIFRLSIVSPMNRFNGQLKLGEVWALHK